MELTRIQFRPLTKVAQINRGMAFGIIIVAALFAFEIFNYSTTTFALKDLLGDIRFAGIHWATILAIAFCGIDFAGIARLFTPESGPGEMKETWYLFGAWLLAATMNAMLTWWGISLAIVNQQSQGIAVVQQSTLLQGVPIFISILVWMIRVLIIGTFSVAGERLFSMAVKPSRPRPNSEKMYRPFPSTAAARTLSTVYPPASRAHADSLSQSHMSYVEKKPLEMTYEDVETVPAEILK